MTFIRKYSGDRTKPIVAVYTCPDHGEFDATVERDGNGEAPDSIRCPYKIEECCDDHFIACGESSSWTPSPVAGRVRRVEVVRGKWEKPEHKTYLDTRKLGEGQDVEEFQAEREKVWDEERQKMVRELARE